MGIPVAPNTISNGRPISYGRTITCLLSSTISTGRVMSNDFLDLFHRELVEHPDRGVAAERGRQDGTRFLLAADVYDDPGFVVPVHAAPVCIRQEMGAGG